MKLEDQVVSLELAKKLKELGVKQESLFYWVKSRRDEKTWIVDYSDCCGLCSQSYNGHRGDAVSAFTVAELGELLPAHFWNESIDKRMYLQAQKKDNYWYIAYWDSMVKFNRKFEKYKEAKTEADARAKMLIYLIENKLLPVQS